MPGVRYENDESGKLDRVGIGAGGEPLDRLVAEVCPKVEGFRTALPIWIVSFGP